MFTKHVFVITVCVVDDTWKSYHMILHQDSTLTWHEAVKKKPKGSVKLTVSVEPTEQRTINILEQ